MKRLCVLLLFCLAMLALAPTVANAVLYQVSDSGGSAGGGAGSQQGGTSGMVNDVKGVNNYRLTFNSGWLLTLLGKCANGNKYACKGEPPATIYRAPAPAGGRGTDVTPGFGINADIADQVKWTNTCEVASPEKIWSSGNCVKSLSGVTGNNSWGEVHYATPSGSGSQPTAGPITNVSVRVWRECAKGEDKNYSTAGSGSTHASASGSKCTVDPIFERVIPYTDGDGSYAPTQADYFTSHRSGGKTVPGGQNAQSGFTSDSAGPLFGDCLTAAREAGVTSLWCQDDKVEKVTNDSDSGSFFEDHCQSGVIGSPVHWSDREIIQEANYRMANGLIHDNKDLNSSRGQKIIAWAADGRKVNGQKSLWPPAISHDQACDWFSERLTVGWGINTGADNGKPSAHVNLRLNGIAGRLYGVQMVYLDNRENIVQQTFAVRASESTAVAEPTEENDETCTAKNGKKYPWPKGTPMPAECGDPAACPDALGVLHYYKAGDPQPGVCNWNPTEINAATSPAAGHMTAIFPNTQLVGQQAPVEVRSSPEQAAGGDPNGATTTLSGRALWEPRNLKLSIYNSHDDNTGADDAQTALGKYQNNHTIGILASGSAWLTSPVFPVISPHPLSGNAKVWSSHVPLLWNPDNSYGNKMSVRVANPTRSLPQNQAYDAGARARAYEARFATLLGESRFPYQFKIDSAGKAPSVSYGDWERLTADNCGAAQIQPKIKIDGQYKNCANYELAKGWRVEDAYKLPSVTSNSGASVRLDLPSNFNQAKDGPGHIILDSDNPTLSYFLGSPEVWKFDEYMKRQEGDTPTYRSTGDWRQVANFCWPWIRGQWDVWKPPVVWDYAGPGDEDDVIFPGHWETHYGWVGNPDCGANPNSRLDDADRGTSAYPTGIGPDITNPALLVNMLDRDGSYVADLPRGDYVIVWPVYVGPGQTLPATNRWGIQAAVQRNTTMKWANAFDMQQQSKMTSVFRTRAVG